MIENLHDMPLGSTDCNARELAKAEKQYHLHDMSPSSTDCNAA